MSLLASMPSDRHDHQLCHNIMLAVCFALPSQLSMSFFRTVSLLAADFSGVIAFTMLTKVSLFVTAVHAGHFFILICPQMFLEVVTVLLEKW